MSSTLLGWSSGWSGRLQLSLLLHGLLRRPLHCPLHLRSALLTVLRLSAAYNMPVSRVKWVLRRFDHSAIYLLIAGTYTPFIAQLKRALCRPA